ncbi:MAG: cytochrome c-type biogenesis protein [Pseudomonadota bacterium]
MRTLLAAMFMLLAMTAHGAIEFREFESLEEEKRFRTLAEEIRCLVCQNQSLADSGAGLATDLRNEIVAQMRAGKSDAEIKVFLTERYGDFVLYRPPVRPGTWALWYGPAVLVLLGGAIFVVAIRRRSQREGLIADPDQEELDRRLEEEL